MANITKNKNCKRMMCILAAMMLAMPASLFAQDQEEAEQKVPEKVARVVKKYPTKELFGMVLDEATNAPISGVKVQALGNPNYAAMTDEEGYFKIKVPDFVTALYVFTPDYLSQQVPVDPDDTETPIRIKMLSDKFYEMYGNDTKYTATKKVNMEGHYATPDGHIN